VSKRHASNRVWSDVTATDAVVVPYYENLPLV
jgi:hypothetical protein